MAPFVDSHAHLADPAFDRDREAVIARARDAGALAIIAIGESLAAAERARDIAERHPGFVAWTAGVHPHDAAQFDPQADPARIRDCLRQGAVAVGECGLDYHYDHAPREVQRRVFASQLALAAETGRPVVVHTREADDDTTAMLVEAAAGGVRGVLHCFTGPRALAEQAVVAGWYVSFSGIVTFKRWTDDDLLRFVPVDQLLIETDAPYLAPVPHRGHRNEPAHATRTLARVAAARGTTADVLGSVTARNAARLFALAIVVPPT
jgi:TatD DNase family protein